MAVLDKLVWSDLSVSPVDAGEYVAAGVGSATTAVGLSMDGLDVGWLPTVATKGIFGIVVDDVEASVLVLYPENPESPVFPAPLLPCQIVPSSEPIESVLSELQ